MPKRTKYTIRRTELSKSLYDAIISEVANHHQFKNFNIRTLTVNFECIKEYKINDIDKIIDRLERYLLKIIQTKLLDLKHNYQKF